MCDPRETYANLREAETRLWPDYRRAQDLQREVTPAVRRMLMNWVTRAGYDLGVSSEALLLAAGYIDRFLCTTSVLKRQLKVLGLTCLFVAAKFQDVAPPRLLALSQQEAGIEKDELEAFELVLLSTLNFKLCGPTVLQFLPYFLVEREVPPELELFANFLAELSPLRHSLLRYPPSTIAAACVVLAHLTLRLELRAGTTLSLCGIEGLRLKTCVCELNELFTRERAVFFCKAAAVQKYSRPELARVSCRSARTSLFRRP